MKTVSFLEPGNLLQLCYIAVCYIVHTLNILNKLIAVLDNHQFIITDKAFFLELYG